MTRRWRRVISAAAVAIGVVACGRNTASPPSAETGAGMPVVVSSLSDLRTAVPELPGWTRGEIAAQEEQAPARSAHVTVTFTRGSERMELEIADTGGNERAIESLEHLAGSDTSRTLENGYFKGTTVAGFPAVDSWNTVDRLGEVTVLIRRRFIIHVAGSGLADAAPMRLLAEAVDPSKFR